MQNTIIYLIGYPGVGKYTTGKAIADKTEGVLLDNQLTAMPLFTVMAHDTSKGDCPHIEKLYEKYHQIAAQVFEMMQYAPPALNYVLTDVLLNDSAGHEHFNRVQDMAKARNSFFLPVLLTCENDVLINRVSSSERVSRFKLANTEVARGFISSKKLFNPRHSNMMVLNNTGSSPESNAEIIIEQARKIQNGCAHHMNTFYREHKSLNKG
ncbi:MAG: hypothetical protein DHS20C02_09980 [Micavibrio sp.]|nr:MAG: hypothetical protein DHS20C02_09980 [Micavibrio sp.]